MASLTQWTWVWVNSGSWWWTGRPGVLRFMGLQRVGHDWATELNWLNSPTMGVKIPWAGLSLYPYGNCIIRDAWVEDNEKGLSVRGCREPRNVLTTTKILHSRLVSVFCYLGTPEEPWVQAVSEWVSHSILSNSLWPYGLYSPWNSLVQNTGVGSLSPGDLPNPGIEPRSPTLQADSLLTEPQGKPKNTGVGSLSLLQQIFLAQESNHGLLHCGWIIYQLS